MAKRTHVNTVEDAHAAKLIHHEFGHIVNMEVNIGQCCSKIN